MDMFNISAISPLVWILLGLGLVAAVVAIILGSGRFPQLIRMIRMQAMDDEPAIEPEYVENSAEEVSVEETIAEESVNEEAVEEESVVEEKEVKEVPKISIIAYTRGDVVEVGEFLRAVSEQDYPSVEVVVVVDGPAREAANLAETYGETYPFAGFSFVPPEALNLSRRKLANTIGIKKATGDIVLTTYTNIEIPSHRWLSLMASQFTDQEVEIVLGAAFMDLSRLTGLKRWYRGFDTLLTTSRWMLYAIDGKPYRGDGANLAFRRSMFFRNSGYGNNYFLHAGDDDIFVSQVATASNSRFMLAPQATIRVDWGDASRRQWINFKERYSFAGRYLSAAPRLTQACINIAEWLATGSLAAVMALCLPANLLAPIIALVLLLAMWGMQISLYRRLAATFHTVRLWWSVPLFYLIRPIADFTFRVRYMRRANQNFTWRR